jgi:acyl carrier protein
MRQQPDPELLDQVTRIVSRVILESTGRSVLPEPDDRLLEKGWLDSLSIVNLVLALQLEMQVTLEVTDLSELNFGSVRAITSLVARQRR